MPTKFLLVSLLALGISSVSAIAVADPRYESHTINAGRPDGAAPDILGTDPLDTCIQAISRTTYVPHSADPIVQSYSSQVSGGYTSRWYHCSGRYPQLTGHDQYGNPIIQIVTGDVTWMYAVCPPTYIVSWPYGICSAKVYVSAQPAPAAQCGPAKNCVGEPINPINGSVFSVNGDTLAVSNNLDLSRYYNSLDAGTDDLTGGWRHSFSRTIRPRYLPIAYRPYVAADALNSSLYADEAAACTNGFLEIRPRMPGLASAIATYENGACKLSTSGMFQGTLQLYADQAGEFQSLPLIGFDAVRDDGQQITFVINSGAIASPSGVNLKLTQVGSGYSLIDGNDSIESYDTSGKLLSVTYRTGVVQTMSYDASGRLIGVTDSFGHQLILNYDAQGRLSAVTH